MLNSTFIIPKNIVGDNGYWVASNSTEWNAFKTEFALAYANEGLRAVEVCLKGSGAVSFIGVQQCENYPPCDGNVCPDEEYPYCFYCDDVDCYPCLPDDA
jgi:hypothetical protein